MNKFEILDWFSKEIIFKLDFIAYWIIPRGKKIMEEKGKQTKKNINTKKAKTETTDVKKIDKDKTQYITR